MAPRIERALKAAVLVSLTLASCRSGDRVDTDPSASAPPAASANVAPIVAAPITDAAELCALLFGAPRKTLEATCPAGKGPREALHELESSESRCVAIIGESLASGKTVVTRGKAEACGAEIRGRWERYPAFARRMGSEALNLDVHSACAALFQGTVAEGAACNSTLECSAPLTCSGSDAQRFCVKPAGLGRPCGGTAADQLASRPGCEPNGFCNREIAPDPNGALSASSIQRVIGARAPRFRSCYEAGVHRNPKLEGRVVIQFSIQKDGTVGPVSGKGSDLGDAAVVSCIERAFSKLRFPEGVGASSITYPITFTSIGAEPPPPTAQKSAAARERQIGLIASRSNMVAIQASSPLVCSARAKKGEACSSSRGCVATLVCKEERCVDAATGGLSCERDHDCPLADRCHEVDGDARCTTLKAKGDACETDLECALSVCTSGRCAGPCTP